MGERMLGQKAEHSLVNDTKARFLALEVLMEQKAERTEIGDVGASLRSLREWTTWKVDQLASDFSKRPEAEAMLTAENALDQLRCVAERKVDAEEAAQRFAEVGRKFE